MIFSHMVCCFINLYNYALLCNIDNNYVLIFYHGLLDVVMKVVSGADERKFLNIIIAPNNKVHFSVDLFLHHEAFLCFIYTY